MTDEAYSRMAASALTWPVEKSKLIFQGASQQRATIGSVMRRLLATSPTNHVLGMTSSGLQRGMSAYFMFYFQGHTYGAVKGTTGMYAADQALAGAVSGTMTAPIHTVWELIKVRGSAVGKAWKLPKHSLHMYSTCLVPMVCRHGIFDGIFFGVTAVIAPYSESSGIRFAAAAATASFANLLWDVWKTQQMQEYPKRISFRQIVRPLTWRGFLAQYIVKGVDLTANWFAVGVIKDRYFG